ncbi:MAG: hypothetical protein AB1781_03865 [Pseudomonadota bacterium]
MTKISRHHVPRLPPRIPKVREYVEITLHDGKILKGHVFIEATMRIQDLLNDPNQFFPFLDEAEQMHLISKTAVAHVRPYDG